jgi:hypothetical protein
MNAVLFSPAGRSKKFQELCSPGYQRIMFPYSAVTTKAIWGKQNSFAQEEHREQE